MRARSLENTLNDQTTLVSFSHDEVAHTTGVDLLDTTDPHLDQVVLLSSMELRAVAGYSGPAYRLMNARLRDQIGPDVFMQSLKTSRADTQLSVMKWATTWVPLIDKWNKLLVAALERLISRSERSLYRAVAAHKSQHVCHSLIPGQVLVEPAFMSCMENRTDAEEWAKGCEGGCLFTIESGAKATNIDHFSLMPWETEWVFRPGSRFRILEKTEETYTHNVTGEQTLWLITLRSEDVPYNTIS